MPWRYSHDIHDSTKDTWGRRSRASATKRGSRFASGPRCARRRWCAPSRERPLGECPSWNGLPGLQKDPKGSKTNQKAMKIGMWFLILWWCLMFCVVPNRKLGKRRSSAVVLLFLLQGAEMWYSKMACLWFSMYFLVKGKSMVVNHSDFGLPNVFHSWMTDTWLLGMAGSLANGADLFTLGKLETYDTCNILQPRWR